MSKEITLDILKNCLTYDENNGDFIWIVNKGIKKIGDIAGNKHWTGYIRIKIGQKEYLAHRLAWFYKTGKWPKNQIDHINSIRNDNRFCNLREATQQQNNFNKTKKKNTASLYKGLTWRKDIQKWNSRITINDKCINLGYFDTQEEAYQVYMNKAKELFGDYAKL